MLYIRALALSIWEGISKCLQGKNEMKNKSILVPKNEIYAAFFFHDIHSPRTL